MDTTSKDEAIVGYFALATAIFAPCVVIAAWIFGNAIWLPLAISALFASAAFIATRMSAEVAKPLVAVGVIGQCIALTAAMAGTPWQIDAHMTFFAALAVLVVLNDVRTILVGTAAIALHHLGLSVAVPSLVYPSADLLENLERTAFHAVVVVVEAAALSFAIQRQQTLRAEIAEGVDAVTEASKAAEAARDAAQKAQRDAEEQRNLALEAQTRAENAVSDLEDEKRQTIALHEASTRRETPRNSKRRKSVARNRNRSCSSSSMA